MVYETRHDAINDVGYYKYISWANTIGNNENYKYLWSNDNLSMIQRKITEILRGLREDGRPIIVPFDIIGNVLFQCIQTNNNVSGDMYTMYIITRDNQRNDVSEIINRTINIITSQIRNEYEIEQNNKKLTIWSTLYGTLNEQGLRAHAPIKIRKGGPDRFMFQMNY